MFRKIKNRNLFILFLVLVAGVTVLLISERKSGERNFKSRLVQFDTTAVKGIYITPRAQNSRTITLEKVNGDWVVVNNQKDYKANTGRVKELLQTLLELSPKSLTATKKERWAQYEVTDSLGTRVVVRDNKGKELADVIIGKFEYQASRQQQNAMQMRGRQPQGAMQTHVRNADEKDVYLVDGFLNMTFNREWESFRDNTIIKSASTKWNKLVYQYPADSSFILQRENSNWMLDGQLADSAKVVQFVNRLDSQSGNNFVDDPVSQTSDPVYSLRIEGEQMDPIEVNAYPADSTHRFLIQSSQNKGIYFSSPKGQLVQNIFVSKDELLPAAAE